MPVSGQNNPLYPQSYPQSSTDCLSMRVTAFGAGAEVLHGMLSGLLMCRSDNAGAGARVVESVSIRRDIHFAVL